MGVIDKKSLCIWDLEDTLGIEFRLICISVFAIILSEMTDYGTSGTELFFSDCA